MPNRLREFCGGYTRSLLSGLFVLAMAHGVLAQTGGGRTITYRQGVSLFTQLNSDDTVVTVDRTWQGGTPTTVGAPTTRDLIALPVVHAAAVVVLRVESVEPRLTDDDSWITTEIIGRVAEVLVAKSSGLSKGLLLSVNHEWGGEAIINGVRIRAGFPLALRQVDTCLAFISKNDARPWGAIHTLLKVENGRLVDSQKAHRPLFTDPFDGLRWADTKRVIRDIARDVAAHGTETQHP